MSQNPISQNPTAPTPNNRNPSEDSTSVYFLGSHDFTCASIVGDIFNGSNYISWSKSILMALNIKNKVRFIDGTLPCPDDSSILLKTCWIRANNLVMSWLLNSVTKEIRQSLLYFASALDIWSELKTRYDRTDGSRVYQLQKTLSTISQGNSSVTEFYNLFRANWDECISQRPIATCTCGLCTCNVNKSMLNLHQSDCVLKFLIGLNDSYSSIRSQILLMSPLPALSKVYSMILQEENHRVLTTAPTLDSLAMFTRQKPNDGQFKGGSNQPNTGKFPKSAHYKDKKKLKCTHCGYSGHTVDKCFQIIGYPPEWDGPTGKRPPPTHSANLASAEDNTPSDSQISPAMSANQLLYEQFLAFQQAQSQAQNVAASTVQPSSQAYAASAVTGHTHEEDDWFC